MTETTDMIEIEAEPRQTFNVRLVGVEYEVVAPKGSLTMVMAKSAKSMRPAPSDHKKKSKGKAGEDDKDIERSMAQMDGVSTSMDTWIGSAFRSRAQEIRDRLMDPEDDLDYPHLMTLMKRLSEATTGNPST